MKGKNDTVWVRKASGEPEYFSPERLARSLEKAGASPDAIADILASVEKMLHPGISTRKIYREAFRILKQISPAEAGRYKLKKAIQELGPSGYPFEQYVGELLRAAGYQVQVGVRVQGQCVQHEVDVVAEKDDRHFMIECKFHSDDGRKCDVKVPLYIHSRFLDVEKAWRKQPGHAQKFHQGWVVTNTRFTSDAIQYGRCAGMKLLGWDHPRGESLKERIDRAGLHPITCLTTLSKKEKQALLAQKIVLCKTLCRQEEALLQLRLPASRVKRVLQEAAAICEKP